MRLVAEIVALICGTCGRDLSPRRSPHKRCPHCRSPLPVRRAVVNLPDRKRDKIQREIDQLIADTSLQGSIERRRRDLREAAEVDTIVADAARQQEQGVKKAKAGLKALSDIGPFPLVANPVRTLLDESSSVFERIEAGYQHTKAQSPTKIVEWGPRTTAVVDRTVRAAKPVFREMREGMDSTHWNSAATRKAYSLAGLLCLELGLLPSNTRLNRVDEAVRLRLTRKRSVTRRRLQQP